MSHFVLLPQVLISYSDNWSLPRSPDTCEIVSYESDNLIHATSCSAEKPENVWKYSHMHLIKHKTAELFEFGLWYTMAHKDKYWTEGQNCM